MQELSGLRSLAGSTSTAMEAANPRPSPDTGEKPVQEQASVESDLEMAHVKLRRATKQIDLLEGKLQPAVNENAKLKVKQTEDLKLWQGLDSKLSSTKTLCDQLTETLQQLASQTEQRRQEMLQIKQEKEEMDRSYKERLYLDDARIKKKDSLIKLLEGSVEENKSRLICLDSRLQCMEQELKLKDDVCISLKGNLASSESEKNSLELMNKGHILEIEKLCQDNKDLKELLSSFMVKVTELDKEHASVSSHVSRLISSFERFYEMAQEEKMLMARSSVEREKTLEDQKLQVEASLSATEYQLSEAKKQYDLMLEGEKIELSKQLKELSLKNDKVINEIHKKYELEKVEITYAEKEKAEKLIRETENKCNEKILQNKYDSERYLIWLKEEHGTMVARIQQDNEHKESTLWAYHKEELQRIQSRAEIELREGLSLIRKEHELQIKSLRMHQEEECRRMQEELELQKSKMEDNQRALLQLQWKVLGESQQVDKEVNVNKQVDDIWDKRQIIYVLVLTTTASLVFLLQPLLPVTYSRWIIFVIAAVWGLGSIGLPFGLYGTARCEREFSRHTSRVVYTLFSVLVIYGFYLVAMRTGDTSATTSPPLLKKDATDINNDDWWASFFAIGLMVLIGNIWSSMRGCYTGGDRDT